MISQFRFNAISKSSPVAKRTNASNVWLVVSSRINPIPSILRSSKTLNWIIWWRSLVNWKVNQLASIYRGKTDEFHSLLNSMANLRDVAHYHHLNISECHPKRRSPACLLLTLWKYIVVITFQNLCASLKPK